MDMDRYDAIARAFDRRYRIKKTINILISGVILLLGVSACLFGLRLEPSVTIFRFMTFDGTVFTSFGALVFIVVNVLEVLRKTELTSLTVYYIRLSSAAAEAVIFIVVLFSQLPVFSEHLLLFDRYDSFVMHALIPVLAVTSFVINDSSAGKLRPLQRFNGTWFVTFYAAVILTLLGTGLLPHDLIPYFFLDVWNNHWSVTLVAFLFIYGAAYLISWALSVWNRKLSWLWFRNISKAE